jgi:hypothetical protein
MAGESNASAICISVLHQCEKNKIRNTFNI